MADVRPIDSSRTADICLSAAELAKLITGHLSATALLATSDQDIADGIASFMDRLFPAGWRFSRNEGLVYAS